MANEMMAGMLRAMADPTRLRILEVLSCCPERLDQEVNGPTASTVCCAISDAPRINSTVSHHLKELRQSGLIRMERQGKSMICTLDRARLREVAAFVVSLAEGMSDDCCTGENHVA